MRFLLWTFTLAVSLQLQAATLEESFLEGREASIEDLTLRIPDGWRLHQDVRDGETLIAGFESGEAYLTLFVKPGAVETDSVFVNGSQITREAHLETAGALDWRVLETQNKMLTEFGSEMHYVKAFSAFYAGHTYFGYASSLSAERARAAADTFLRNVLIRKARAIKTRSLTGEDYTGKKYYLGWGAAESSDPSNMQNEVKYDVVHTHDIFTKEIGGGYLGTSLIGYANATRTNITKEWKRLRDIMTWNDMYVQYSSGHGSESGLGVGVTYNEIADNTLSYPAKEMMVFIMACHSGGLVDAFNKRKEKWSQWGDYGRTLMVFASSKTSELSSTGPGKDPDEPNGANGSAGSAFGHALWKSLIGYADGYVDGVKDGFLSLGEIEAYTIFKTKDLAGHTPVSTGVYNKGLLMNRVPPKAFLESLAGSSEGLSDNEIMERIQSLDRAMRL